MSSTENSSREPRRRKVYGKLTNEEAARLGLSRITAWRSRQRGWYWINYHERETAYVVDSLSSEMVEAILEDARIGTFWALSAFNVPLRKIGVYDITDLFQEAAEKLVRLAGHPKAVHPAWRRVAAKNAVIGFIRANMKHLLKFGEGAVRIDLLPSADFFDSVRLQAEHERFTPEYIAELKSLREQIRKHVIAHHGEEAWEALWGWACSGEPEPSEEVATLIKCVVGVHDTT